MTKENLFFDLDGTLTDSMPGITRAVRYALRHFGIIEEDLNVLRPFVGPPLRDSFQEFYGFSDRDAKRAVAVFREYYTGRGWMENEPYEGIREMLEELKGAGKRLYVATSKPEDMAMRVLDHFGLTGCFEFVGAAISDSIRAKKDEVIVHVMESCDLLEKKDSILMVGDRKHDILGARKAGIQAMGVLYGYGSREELLTAGADWLCETPKDLPTLLKTLETGGMSD